MNVPIRILVADDHPAVRAGLRALLSSHQDLAVVAEAADGREALLLWEQAQPDLGLFDVCMPGVDGLEALRRIREQQPQATVIILSTLAREADIARAMAAGARACLRKDAEMADIVSCIRSVHIAGAAQHVVGIKPPSIRGTQGSLTRREIEVLEGIARGWSNRSVAAALGIGEGTVKTHLKRAYGKLYARNRTEAAVVARRKGLL